MSTAPLCPSPDLDRSPPRLKAPAGASDTHFHIFGPEHRYPYVAEQKDGYDLWAETANGNLLPDFPTRMNASLGR
jgi:hypothetical protein